MQAKPLSFDIDQILNSNTIVRDLAFRAIDRIDLVLADSIGLVDDPPEQLTILLAVLMWMFAHTARVMADDSADKPDATIAAKLANLADYAQHYALISIQKPMDQH